MRALVSKLKFSLASLLLFTLLCGALLGVWSERQEWVKTKSIPIKNHCSYLRFSGSKLIAIEDDYERSLTRHGNIYDLNSGQLLSSSPVGESVMLTVAKLNNDKLEFRTSPFLFFGEVSHSQEIIVPKNTQTQVYKWDNLDTVQSSRYFNLKEKNVALFEPRGIFLKSAG